MDSLAVVLVCLVLNVLLHGSLPLYGLVFSVVSSNVIRCMFLFLCVHFAGLGHVNMQVHVRALDDDKLS